MKWGLKQLTKKRVEFAKVDSSKAAGIVELPNNDIAVIKRLVDRDWAGFKTHQEILQELIFYCRSDNRGDYAVLDQAVIDEAYDRMHKTSFINRSQHRQIADYLSEFITLPVLVGDEQRTNKLIAIINWHIEQSGTPSIISADIDALFPEKLNSGPEEQPEADIGAAIGRIIS